MTLLGAPAVRGAGRLGLTLRPSQGAGFLLPDELHQLQAGLAQQVADALLQMGDDRGQRQRELHGGVLFSHELLKGTDGSLAVDLIGFLYRDSPFFPVRKSTLSRSKAQG